MNNNQLLILASSSPKRKELLQQVGLTIYKIVSPNINEEPEKKEKPLELVKRLALTKALSIANNYPNTFIIAADTIAVSGTKILGKPKDKNEAESFLNLLSGKKHKVITGVCVIAPNKPPLVKVVTSVVKLKRLSKSEINFYLQSDDWKGKAGGYTLNGKIGLFVEKIIGSYSNILGLPLNTVYNMLIGLGFNIKNLN